MSYPGLFWDWLRGVRRGVATIGQGGNHEAMLGMWDPKLQDVPAPASRDHQGPNNPETPSRMSSELRDQRPEQQLIIQTASNMNSYQESDAEHIHEMG